MRLEGLPDLLPLGVAAVGDDVDDGVLVSSWDPKVTDQRKTLAQLPHLPQ